MRLKPEFNLSGIRQCVVCGSVAHPVARMWYTARDKEGRVIGYTCSPQCQKKAERWAVQTSPGRGRS